MINKDELIKGSLNFIKTYKRLPYFSEDNIEVEKLNDKNEMELKPYRAGKYIKEFFGDYDKFSEYLLQEKILTYEIISKYTNIEANRLKDLLDGTANNVEISERRVLHTFFDKDLYKKLGMVNNRYCKDCAKVKKCGQDYWVRIVYCPKFKDKKKRTKNKNTK